MSDFDDGPWGTDEERQQADLLLERVRELEEPLRKIGIYVVPTGGAIQTIGPTVSISFRADVGDLAFSKRIVDPEAGNVDRQIREMESAEEINGFIDAREDIARRLAAGEDPFSGR